MTTEQESAEPIGSDWEARAIARRHIGTAFAALSQHTHGDESQSKLLAAAQDSLATARRMIDAIDVILGSEAVEES